MSKSKLYDFKLEMSHLHLDTISITINDLLKHTFNRA